MKKKKAIISACLLGHRCRYDGCTKKGTEIIEAFADYEVVPFCPEAPLFGTPRERISVVDINNTNRIITDNTNKDVTKLLEDEINNFIDKHPCASQIVLKAKSPSCGMGTTPILNEKKEKIALGNGIAADIFLKRYKDIDIKDESHFN